MNIEREPKDFSASLARIPEGGHVYRCNECAAVLLNGEDAREHLWWHDKLVTVKR
jgi:hypothetical protein